MSCLTGPKPVVPISTGIKPVALTIRSRMTRKAYTIAGKETFFTSL